MAIVVQCPSCGISSPAADSFSGRSVRCKKCGNPFVAQPTLDGSRSDTQKSQPAGAGNPFPQLPAEFGRYRVQRLLGKGGMGAVYLAKDSQLGREVALKIPFFDAKDSPQRAERFVREARSAAALQHPHICTVFDAGRIAGTPFLTMAFVRGTPLDRAIDPDSPMPQPRAAEIARKVALGLAHAHGKGIVHRDLKPANVMLDENGEPVVMDFGLAKRGTQAEPGEAKRSRHSGDAVPDAKLTRDGGVLGTPSYMSPEQVRGDADVGPASDVYSLGVLLYEMLTGQTPYSGNMGAVMGKILAAPVPPLAESRPDADPRLHAICQRAMAKSADDRFPSMAAFAQALGQYLTTESSVSVELVEPAAPPVVVPAPVYRPVPAPFEDLVEEEDAEPTVRKPRRKRRKPVNTVSRRPLWIGLGVLAAVAGILLMTVRTKHGDVVIELSDPAAKVDVVVDGTRIELAGLDKPLTLTAGEHGLSVTGVDFETVTRSFTVKKGEKEVVKVTLRPKAPLAKNDPPKPADPAEPKNPDPQPPTDPNPPASPVPVASDGFVPLLNGKDLTGWRETGVQGGYMVRNGELVINAPKWEEATRNGWLMTEQSYSDFRLEVEFAIEVGADSGIGLRCDPTKDTQLEVAIADENHPSVKMVIEKDPTFRNGGLALCASDTAAAMRPFGEWNKMVVELIGQRLTIRVNENVTTATLLDQHKDKVNRPGLALSSGPIGIQKRRGISRFRNIKLKDLSKHPPANATSEFVPLFNGKNLTGWSPYHYSGKTKQSDTSMWSFDPTTRVLSGSSAFKQDLRTDAKYSDFHLRLEWRYKPQGKVDWNGSGVVVRSSGEKTQRGADAHGIEIDFRPKADEAKQFGPGCFIAFDCKLTNHRGQATNYDNRNLGTIRNVALKDNQGWNACEIQCAGDRIKVWMNGMLVNEGWNASPLDGYILLRSDLSDVEFRNVELKDLATRRQQPTEFTPLFNGKDLAGWKAVGDPKWAWEDGRLVSTPPPSNGGGYLMTEADWEDFEVELEYRLGAGGNGGLFLRADPSMALKGAGQLEVQILDEGNGPLPKVEHATGSLHGIFARSVAPPIKRGDWNRLRARLIGRKLQVWANDVQTIDKDLDNAALKANTHPGVQRKTGRLALQHLREANSNATVEYRNVRVKDLSAKPKAAAPQPKAELVKLTELPQGQDKYFPSLADGGKTLYWNCMDKGKIHQVWRATRTSTREPFGGSRQVIDVGASQKFSSTENDELIAIMRYNSVGPGVFIGRKKRNELKMDRPVLVPDTEALWAPYISADGSEIVSVMTEKGDGRPGGATVLYSQKRTDMADITAWSKPTPIPIADMPAGRWSWGAPTLSPDKQYLFSNVASLDAPATSPRFMVLRLLKDGKSYGTPRAITLGPDFTYGTHAVYLPASNELFFSGHDTKDTRDLYVLRNFDPERDTEPLK